MIGLFIIPLAKYNVLSFYSIQIRTILLHFVEYSCKTLIMNLYAFELGRKKDLCFAELMSVLGEANLVERNLDTAIFNLEKIDPESLQDRLGGTIKIIEIFKELPKNANTSDIKRVFESFLRTHFEHHKGKIPFALSILSFYNQKEIDIRNLLVFAKKTLKALGLNSRFVNKNFQNTKPSTIYKAKVLQKGIDLNIIKGTKNLLLGETISIQNIDNYSKRDFDKPCRDAKVGMLPPKLSQIMINLAGESKTIFDPFCGTGTILMEGMLMGKDVIGSDMEERMTEYSKKNCEWLIKVFFGGRKKEKIPKHEIFTRDSRFLNKKILPFIPDAIITEGYLGKPISKFPSEKEMEKSFRELANLHFNWLSAIGSFCDAPIIMCTTAFKNNSKIIHLPRFEELVNSAGYKLMESFTYDRPDQVVARDIRVLRKK